MFKAVAEIIGNRNLAYAQQSQRNLEAITAAANLDRQRSAVTVPTQTAISTAFGQTATPENLQDETEQDAAEAATGRRVRDLLMGEVAAYLRECHERDPDLFGEGFAGKCDRWEAERRFREEIYDDLIDIVDDDTEITDDDVRVEIRNLMDECWHDIIPDEEFDP